MDQNPSDSKYKYHTSPGKLNGASNNHAPLNHPDLADLAISRNANSANGSPYSSKRNTMLQPNNRLPMNVGSSASPFGSGDNLVNLQNQNLPPRPSQNAYPNQNQSASSSTHISLNDLRGSKDNSASADNSNSSSTRNLENILNKLETTKKQRPNTLSKPGMGGAGARGKPKRPTNLSTSGHRRARSEGFGLAFTNQVKVAENDKKREKLKSIAGTVTIPGYETVNAKFCDFQEMAKIGEGTTGTVYKMRFNKCLFSSAPVLSTRPAVNGQFSATLPTYMPASLEAMQLQQSQQSQQTRMTQAVVAVKQMNKSGDNREYNRVLQDMDVYHKAKDCAHIVKWYGVIDEADSIWIIMQHCHYGDFGIIKDKVERKRTAITKFGDMSEQDQAFIRSNTENENKSFIPEYVLKLFIFNVLNALHYLKNVLDIIHRDIRPSNVLVNHNGEILLCDFSISTDLNNSRAYTKAAGVQWYLSPERIQCSQLSENKGYDVRADVYALGMTTIELASKEHPYKLLGLNSEMKIATHILNQPSPEMPANLRKYFSADLHSIVADMLTKKVEDRPKYDKLLQHRFLTSDQEKFRNNHYLHKTKRWIEWVFSSGQEKASSNPFDNLGPSTGNYVVNNSQAGSSGDFSKTLSSSSIPPSTLLPASSNFSQQSTRPNQSLLTQQSQQNSPSIQNRTSSSFQCQNYRAPSGPFSSQELPSPRPLRPSIPQRTSFNLPPNMQLGSSMPAMPSSPLVQGQGPVQITVPPRSSNQLQTQQRPQPPPQAGPAPVLPSRTTEATVVDKKQWVTFD